MQLTVLDISKCTPVECQGTAAALIAYDCTDALETSAIYTVDPSKTVHVIYKPELANGEIKSGQYRLNFQNGNSRNKWPFVRERRQLSTSNPCYMLKTENGMYFIVPTENFTCAGLASKIRICLTSGYQSKRWSESLAFWNDLVPPGSICITKRHITEPELEPEETVGEVAEDDVEESEDRPIQHRHQKRQRPRRATVSITRARKRRGVLNQIIGADWEVSEAYEGHVKESEDRSVQNEKRQQPRATVSIKRFCKHRDVLNQIIGAEVVYVWGDDTDSFMTHASVWLAIHHFEGTHADVDVEEVSFPDKTSVNVVLRLANPGDKTTLHASLDTLGHKLNELIM